MAATQTTIPPLTAANFADRMAALIPPGWSAPQARAPGGALYGVLASLGVAPQAINGAARYALAATRIQTAQNGALDLASQDFFGVGLPRLAGETDDNFRARMLAAMLPAGATRAAVTAAVQKVTGSPPRVIEPWRPSDTGAWGLSYWGVNTPTTPFRWTGSLAFQGFIECALPLVRPIGNNTIPCYDASFYWGVAGSSFFDLQAVTPQGKQVVYDAIKLVKVEGTVVWVRFVAPPPALSWDQPGVDWDQPGRTWA